jgi:ABC-2 type transport system ATP-binding protein
MGGRMASPEVQVHDLSKTYPPPFRPLALWRGRRESPRQALTGVSFEISSGEVVALIGPNGAGKSTLLRILSGLLLPSAGTARVCGLDVVTDRPRSRQMVGSALSDDRGLSPRLTVRQNLHFFAALFGLDAKATSERIAALSEQFEATALLDRAVRTLSSGEKARAVLVRALLHGPRLVLLDEVTRSLDPGAAVRLRRQIATRIAGAGAAVLFASHDLSEVESIAQRVVLLRAGQVAAFGRFAEVKPRADEVFAELSPGDAS